MIKLVGVDTGKVYHTAEYKSELFRWLNVEYQERAVTHNINTRKILPESMEFVRA